MPDRGLGYGRSRRPARTRSTPRIRRDPFSTALNTAFVVSANCTKSLRCNPQFSSLTFASNRDASLENFPHFSNNWGLNRILRI
jgi:hypothetical protein